MPLTFQPLPVNADEGLPQRFSVAIGARTYTVTLYVNLSGPLRDRPERVLDFAPPDRPEAPVEPPGFLVLRIDRERPGGSGTVLLRKVVPDPGLVHEAEELAVRVTRVAVARGNLNGRGQLGSQIRIEVAQRWA